MLPLLIYTLFIIVDFRFLPDISSDDAAIYFHCIRCCLFSRFRRHFSFARLSLPKSHGILRAAPAYAVIILSCRVDL